MTQEKKELTMLEKCGILMVALVAKDSMPFSPMKFQSNIGEIQKHTGLDQEELWGIYRFLQEESVKMSMPKERKGLGFRG